MTLTKLIFRVQNKSEAVSGARWSCRGRGHLHVRVGVHKVRGHPRGSLRRHLHVRKLLRAQRHRQQHKLIGAALQARSSETVRPRGPFLLYRV